MNKTNAVIFIAVLVCFLIVNIETQIVLDKGHAGGKIMIGRSVYYTKLVEYDLSTRLIPIALSVVLLSIIFISLSDKENSWVAKIDKRLFGKR